MKNNHLISLKKNTISNFCYQLFLFVFVLFVLWTKPLAAQTPSSTLGIVTSIQLQTPNSHPSAIANEFSGCFDKFRIEFAITNFIPDSTGVNPPEITLTMPSFIILTNPIITTNSGNNIPSTTVIDSSAKLQFSNNTPATPWNGTWALDFEITDCDFINSANFDIDFFINVINQSFDISASTPLSTPTCSIDSLNLSQTCQFALTINKPSLEFISSNQAPFPSHDGDYFTRYDLVERYYTIKATEGITDYFKLEMHVEADIDVLKIEAVDPNGILPPFKIFGDNIPTNYIPGDSTYTILFFENDSQNVQHVVDSSNNFPFTTHPFVSVHISDCEFSAGNNAVLFFDSSSTNTNLILIKETIRIRRVQNCDFNGATTTYKINILCDEIFNPIDPNCSSEEYTLNVICDFKRNIGLSWHPSYLESGNYFPLLNDKLSVCSTASTPNFPSSINYTALIVNFTTKSSLQPPLANGFGTVKLKSLSFNFDTAYFDFSNIVFGNQTDTLHWTWVSTQNPNVMTVQINFEDAWNASLLNFQQPNPNILQNGIKDRLNSNYPDSINRTWLFLPEGDSIGITLTNFHLKDCSNLPFTSCEGAKINAMGGFSLEYYTMCEMIDLISNDTFPSKILLNSDVYSGLANFFTGNSYAQAKPLDLDPIIKPKSHLKFEFKRTAPFGTTCTLLPKHPWQLENRHICNTIGDILHCPNKTYFATLELPSPQGTAPGTTSYYTPDTATITDEFGNIFSCAPIQIDTTNFWIFDCGLTASAYTIEFDVRINCGGIFGLDEFKLKFNSKCDTLCSECIATYSCSSVSLFSHCYGDCPDNIFVGVSDFNLQRNTMGWTSEAAYLIDPTLPDATNVNLEKVYPYDQVKFGSFNGTTTSCTSFLNGIDSISQMNFEVQYDETLLPNINPSKILMNENGSTFRVTPQFYNTGHTNLSTIPTVSSWINGPSGNGSNLNIPLPFTFNYCGINYTNINLTTSGYIQIGSSGAVINTPLSIPSPGMPTNLVALCWGNLNPQVGDISYGFYGSPTSGIVIHFDHVYFLNSATDYISGYIILDSTTNQIRILIEELINPGKSICASGIGNANGSAGFAYKLLGKPNDWEFPSMLPNYNTFNFTPNDSIPCLNAYVIPISDVDTIIGTGTKAGYKFLRYKMDMTAQLTPTCLGVTTIRDLLDAYPCRIDFNGLATINDLELAPDFYPINGIFGLLTYDRILNGGIEHVESCDPYIQNITYFQTNLVTEKDTLVGQNQTLINLNQCQIAYFLNLYLEGGFGINADDFPGEYRPLIVYPTEFKGTPTPDLSIANIEYVDFKHLTGGNPTYTPYNFNSGTNSFINNDPLFYPAVDKDADSRRSIVVYMDRNCATQPDSIYALEIKKFDINLSSG
jgi:hypothetical protein